MEPAATFSRRPEAACPGVPAAAAAAAGPTSPAAGRPPSVPRRWGAARDQGRPPDADQDRRRCRSKPPFARGGALSPPGARWPCGRQLERCAPRTAIPAGSPGHGPPWGRLSTGAADEPPPGGKAGRHGRRGGACVPGGNPGPPGSPTPPPEGEDASVVVPCRRSALSWAPPPVTTSFSWRALAGSGFDAQEGPVPAAAVRGRRFPAPMPGVWWCPDGGAQQEALERRPRRRSAR